jgi:hypothetical protein
MNARLAAFLVGVLLSAGNVFAQSLPIKDPPPVDVAAVMLKEYYATFKPLPEARKCKPEDAKGAWVEAAIFEGSAATQLEEQRRNGKKYIAFGQHSLLFWKRSPIEMDVPAVQRALQRSSTQYILTIDGVMYVYEAGALQSSYLCFITTQPTKEHPAGALMLALPVEKDKPLLATLYVPLGK